MFDVYDEYIEVIKPKMVHIGHDEWWGAPWMYVRFARARIFRSCLRRDINKIHDYMPEKGLKLQCGAITFLKVCVKRTTEQNFLNRINIRHPGGTRPEVVKESIPKDILIFNWFWQDPEKEKELQNFGFKQIYGNFTPNISNWDERVKKIDLVGGAPSSWASTNEFNFGKDLILGFSRLCKLSLVEPYS